jgi:fluoride exporter
VGRHALGILLVFLGGGLGSILRHASNQAGTTLLGRDFPFSTMFVNIVGSFTIGIIAGWLARRGAGGQMLPLFLTTGILGGFTTFSAFSLDAALLWERGQAARAAAYILGSVVPAVMAVFFGLAVIRNLLK